jgi:uncharacterized lipoprotein
MPVSERSRRLMAMAVVALALSGCASYQPDTRYLESEQRPPLQIPAGMDTPDYNEQMLIPSVGPATASDGAVDASDSTALERPPHLDDLP